jgi:hypothetical protein
LEEKVVRPLLPQHMHIYGEYRGILLSEQSLGGVKFFFFFIFLLLFICA